MLAWCRPHLHTCGRARAESFPADVDKFKSVHGAWESRLTGAGQMGLSAQFPLRAPGWGTHRETAQTPAPGARGPICSVRGRGWGETRRMAHAPL